MDQAAIVDPTASQLRDSKMPPRSGRFGAWRLLALWIWNPIRDGCMADGVG